MLKPLTARADLTRLVLTMGPDDGAGSSLEWLGGRVVTSHFEWDGPAGDVESLRFAEWRVVNGDVLTFQRPTASSEPTITFVPGGAGAVLYAPLVAFAAIAGISPYELNIDA